jgi:leader peptidase (prepilin peptidase)/N-methyltransferase
MILIKVLVASMLGISGIIDLKWKKINILLIIPFLVAGIVCNLMYDLLSLASIMGGIGIGIVIIGIGVISRGKIGCGDGVILIATGLFLGFFDNLLLLLSATFLAAILGAILLLIKGVNKNYELPFIPFLFVSFLGDLILWS